MAGVSRYTHTLFGPGTLTGLRDGQLLDRFATGHDEAAFEELLRRHGPLVLGLCRRRLESPDDIADAFQATFLVLVRKAGSLRDRDRLGNWLYGVARRVSSRARVSASRRRTIERLAAFEPVVHDDADRTLERAERDAIVAEEILRLPAKYREVV